MHNIPGTIRGFDVHTGQAALEVQSDSAAGRVRRGHVEERLEDRQRRASARTTRGRRTPPIRSSVSSTSRSASRSPTNTAAIVPGDNLFGNSDRRDRREDGPAQVAFPDGASRHLGLRHPDGAEPSRRHVERSPAQDHRVDDEAGLGLRARSRDGRADLADARDAGVAERSARRTDVADAADSDTARAVLAAGPGRVGSHRLHAGDQGFGAQARAEVPHGPVLHPGVAGRRQGHERHRRSIPARGTRRARAAA